MDTHSSSHSKTGDNAISTIDIDKSRYDLDSYGGRVRHFFQMIDPSTIFASRDQLEAHRKLIADYKSENLTTPVSEEQLWNAKKVLDSALHPDTKEVIPFPFRMSFFTPGNLAIVAGMLGARAIGPTVFWQGINQTYNVAVNYANRNASNELSNSQLMQSYAIAMGSSVGTAVGLNEWVKRTTRFPPAVRNNLLALVPFTAVATANLFNIGAMRWSEVSEGVSVKDKDGNVVGKSTIVGRSAVLQTIFSRMLLILPSMVIPPLIMNRLDAHWLLKDFPKLRTPINLSLLTIFIAGCLPFGLSLFPQQGSMKTKELEPHFHDLKNDKGEIIDTIYFNKGL